MESPTRRKVRRWVPALILLLIVNVAVLVAVRAHDSSPNTFKGSSNGITVTVKYNASGHDAGVITYADIVHDAAKAGPVTYLTVNETARRNQTPLIIGGVEVVTGGPSVPAARLHSELGAWQAASANGSTLNVRSAANIAFGEGNAGNLDGIDSVWIVHGKPTDVKQIDVTFVNGAKITAR
jgi:hypothetical protein